MRNPLLVTVGALLVAIQVVMADIPLAEPIQLVACQEIPKIQPATVPICDPLITYLFSPVLQTIASSPHKGPIVFSVPVYASLISGTQMRFYAPIYLGIAYEANMLGSATAYSAALSAESTLEEAPVYDSVVASKQSVAEAPAYSAALSAESTLEEAPVYDSVVASKQSVAEAPVYSAALSAESTLEEAPVYDSVVASKQSVAEAPVYSAASTVENTVFQDLAYFVIAAGASTVASSPFYSSLSKSYFNPLETAYAAIGHSSYLSNLYASHPLMHNAGIDFIADVVKPTGLAMEFYNQVQKAMAEGDNAAMARWNALYLREITSQEIRNSMRRQL